jgi:hypothetical protein
MTSLPIWCVTKWSGSFVRSLDSHSLRASHLIRYEVGLYDNTTSVSFLFQPGNSLTDRRPPLSTLIDLPVGMKVFSGPQMRDVMDETQIRTARHLWNASRLPWNVSTTMS